MDENINECHIEVMLNTGHYQGPDNLLIDALYLLTLVLEQHWKVIGQGWVTFIIHIGTYY